MQLQDITCLDADGIEYNAHEYLVADGNLAVPGGRYGSDTRECAPIALMLYAVLFESSGEATVDALEWCMSAVVNSADDVSWSILDNRHVLERYDVDPFDYFDADEIAYARELYSAAYCGAAPTF